MTADELLMLPRGRARHELIKGELVTMSPAGGEHGAIIEALFLLVAEHVKRHRVGIVFGAETGFLIERNPDTVRAPDIAYIRRERIPAENPPIGFWPGAPDLAVKIVSPDDTIRKIDGKVAD